MGEQDRVFMLHGGASMAGGRATEETRILVCQCGSTSFDEHKRTATAVVLSCRKCGLDISVKGRVAVVRAAREEVNYALEATVAAPEPPAADDPGAPAKDRKATLGEQGYEQFRFRVTKDQAAVVRRALEAIRVQHCHQDEYRCQAWQGHAIEAMAAEVLSGMHDAILQVVDAQEEAVRAEAARVAEKGKALTSRAEGKVRIRVRDTMAAALGIVPTQALERFPHRTDDLEFAEQARKFDAERKAAEEAAETRILDDGRLALAARRARESLAEVNPELGAIRLALEAGEFVALLKWTDEHAGFLVRVQGDRRTRDRAGQRPTIWAWLPADDADNPWDIELEYQDAYHGVLSAPACTVTEILPADWEQIHEADRWDGPSIAHDREVYLATTGGTHD